MNCPKCHKPYKSVRVWERRTRERVPVGRGFRPYTKYRTVIYRHGSDVHAATGLPTASECYGVAKEVKE